MEKKIFLKDNLLYEDENLDKIIRDNPSGKRLIFSVIFYDAETLKQLFSFLSNAVDICPLIFNENSINIFKIKQGNGENTSPSMIIDIVFNKSKLYYYDLDLNLSSNKTENFHAVTIETGRLSAFVKQAKVNDTIKIVQYENEKFLRCTLISSGSPSHSMINISEYNIEICNFNNSINESNIESFVKIPCNEFSLQCATLTKTNKISATTHFIVHKDGLIIHSDNRELPSKEFGIIDDKVIYHFIFQPSIIKILGLMKKFNTRGIAEFFAKDGNVFRIDTSLGTFGEITIFLINQEPSSLL